MSYGGGQYPSYGGAQYPGQPANSSFAGQYPGASQPPMNASFTASSQYPQYPGAPSSASGASGASASASSAGGGYPGLPGGSPVGPVAAPSSPPPVAPLGTEVARPAAVQQPHEQPPAPTPAPIGVPPPVAAPAAPALASSYPAMPSTKAPPANPDEPLDVYAYYRARGYKDEQILEARSEHVDNEPDMCMDDTELNEYGGTAIFAFYKFLKFVAIMMFALFLLALINFLVYNGDRNPHFNNDPIRSWYNDFFISNYRLEQRSAWLGTTVVSIIVMFFACPYYYRYIGGYQFEGDQVTLADAENMVANLEKAEDAIVRYTHDQYIDVSARYRPWSHLFLRRFFSVGVFAGFIVIQVFTSIAITRSEATGEQSAQGAFAVAFIAALLNISYQLIARQMTEVEKLETKGAADKSLTLKLILFKIANVIAVFGAKEYPTNLCVYDIVGEQFMTLLFVEIVFVTPLTVIFAALLTRFHEWYGWILNSLNGDALHLAQFDMAIEYLANLYKFYLACMALVVFPMSTAMSLFAFFLEFWASRYRLIKICGKPTQSASTMRGTVTAVMMLIFFATLFTPFAGAVWIMARWSTKRTSTEDICGKFP